MKTTLLLFCLLMGGSALAQQLTRPLLIRQAVATDQVSQQQAPTTISAYNQIMPRANVHYLAGQAITLLPGFQAQVGSVFAASIGSVFQANGEPSLQAQAYPNPFVDQLTINYTLPQASSVRHVLLDIKGQLVGQFQKLSEQVAGLHQQSINTADLPAGVYVYQLQAGGQITTVRVLKKP